VAGRLVNALALDPQVKKKRERKGRRRRRRRRKGTGFLLCIHDAASPRTTDDKHILCWLHM
jgi:hypothetical protein